MLVKTMAEEEIYDIGHAFGYYDYGRETGMTAALVWSLSERGISANSASCMT